MQTPFQPMLCSSFAILTPKNVPSCWFTLNKFSSFQCIDHLRSVLTGLPFPPDIAMFLESWLI